MSAVTVEATKLRLSPTRVAIGLVLLGWAVMFTTLWLTGRTYLYLSSRTAWLVPMGAAIMSVAAIGRLWTARTANEEPLEPRTAWALGVIAVPVVLVLALPPSALGSFSAGKRSTYAGSAIGATARDVTGPLDFVDIGAAQSFPTAMQELQARAGQPITLEGFVTQDASAPPDEILLTRYIVTCCVADATVAQVRIVGLPPGEYPSDEWLQVTGAVYPVGRSGAVGAEADQLEPVLHAGEPGTLRDPVERAVKRRLEVGRHLHVAHRAAVRTHQMVVVADQILRELVAPVLLIGGHPPHDARLFERREVAVGRALLHIARRLEDLRDRPWARGVGEQPHEVAALPGVALADAS